MGSTLWQWGKLQLVDSHQEESVGLWGGFSALSPYPNSNCGSPGGYANAVAQSIRIVAIQAALRKASGKSLVISNASVGSFELMMDTRRDISRRLQERRAGPSKKLRPLHPIGKGA